MDWARVGQDVGGAGLVATAVTALLLVACPAGRRWQVGPFAFCLAFFVALTQLPLPDPSALVCPSPETWPRLRPFRFATQVVDRARDGSLLWALTHSRGMIASLMNLVLCAAIGVAAGPLVRGWLVTVALGAGMSLLIELTQMTAFWGLYPCPYRQLDVDDLILNTAGVAIGAALYRAWRSVAVTRRAG